MVKKMDRQIQQFKVESLWAGFREFLIGRPNTITNNNNNNNKAEDLFSPKD